MKIKINVTQENINNGRKSQIESWIESCPIAQAIRQQTNFSQAVVMSIYWKIKPVTHALCLPRSAQRFIKRFDDGISVKPFSFFLNQNRIK